MSTIDIPAYADRLHRAALSARERLDRSPVKRWEVYAKASFTREAEVSPSRPLRIIEVEETGVAVRSLREGKFGFAAASGLGDDASRRAVEGALAAESAVDDDPLPPLRLLGTTEVGPARALPPRGWATHAGQELARAVADLSGNNLRLRRAVFQEGAFGWILATGDGWVARHEDVSTTLLAEVEAVDDRSGVWRDWVHIASADSFDLEAAAARITDRALLTRSRVATDSGLRDLILHPEVSAQLLAAMTPLFVAKPETEGLLPPLLDGEGRLASSVLTLVDDRRDWEAPLTGPCDGEGLPAGRTLLLDEGVPRHRLASFRDARRCGETPRGGSVRLSYRDSPATGIANLKVVTDEGVAASELLGAADRALYLLRPLAPVSCRPQDDSYRIVASGVWLDGRQVRGWHPVVELKGSLGRLLRRIEVVGTDLRWFQGERGCVGAPSLLIRRQSVLA